LHGFGHNRITMLNHLMKLILILLLIFTPVAFGSVELWAFSLMELGILLILSLWAIQSLFMPMIGDSKCPPPQSEKSKPFLSRQFEICNLKFAIPFLLLSLFLLLILFQMLPLAPDILKIVSPQTFFLRQQLLLTTDQLPMTTLSFVPFLTQIEFLKWLTLIGLFLFLLRWRYLDTRTTQWMILVIFGVGVFESLYGMFEFFSGHKHILHLKMDHLISSVTGTFINRNAFAGYLLMVTPLSMGYLFSREPHAMGQLLGLRNRLSSLDGKSLLIAFGIVLMILSLLFSASRMGIGSLLLSFSLISILFRNPQGSKKLSRPTILILGLALLWAAWIGLDAVISRFFTTSESFEDRWKFWLITSQIIKDFPLFGSGLGTFTQVFPMYRSFHIRALVTHAENDLLQLASEVGLIGAGLLLVLFIYLFYRAISGLRFLSYRDPERYIAMGGLIGILALMFHSLVERNIQIPANALLYVLIWALILRTTNNKEKSNSMTQ